MSAPTGSLYPAHEPSACPRCRAPPRRERRGLFRRMPHLPRTHDSTPGQGRAVLPLPLPGAGQPAL